MITRTKETTCPECGTILSAIGEATEDGSRQPQPGDPIACIRCGAVMTCDEEHNLRGLTQQEINELAADAEVMEELAMLLGKIHWLRASVG